MFPDRVTVKVNVVLPLLPSFWLAFVAAIASDGAGSVPSIWKTANPLSFAFSTLPGELLPGPT